MTATMKATPEQADRLHRFAHDLRNRLGALQQALAQLNDAPPDEREAMTAFAEQQYFKAMRATEELLDDLGIDRAQQPQRMEPMDLGGAVRRAIDLQAHRIARKQQHLTADLAPDVLVKGDPRMLEDLITALLSNASKFSPEGAAIAVTLTCGDGTASLSVRDAGIGMDEEDLAQVFTRYAVLKGRSTAGEAQGRSTLARARQWAQAHGGSLHAESPGPGQGAVFTLRLPLA